VLRPPHIVLRQRGHSAIGLTVVVGALSLAVGLAGCSTGSTSSTETVTGVIGGAGAADYLNNREGPLTFPLSRFTGPVTTSASNATIATSSSQTIATSAGIFAVTLSLRRKPRTLPH